MNMLENDVVNWQKAGYTIQVLAAPKDAVSFDKMVVILTSRGGKPSVYRLSLWNSEKNTYVGHY